MIRRAHAAGVLVLALLLRAASASALEPETFRWSYTTEQIRSGVRDHTGSLRPLDAPSLGSGRFRRLPLQAALGLRDAGRRAVWPEQDGIRVGDSPFFAAQGGGEASLTGAWRLRGEALALFGGDGPSTLRLQQGYLARLGSDHTLVFGKSIVRWGNGLAGSLLLGRSAPPRWQIRWRTAHPFDLPGSARRFGTWQGESFLSYLDDAHRRVPDPLLHGLRLSWEPSDWLQISGSRTILFGGKDRTGRLKFVDLWNILAARGENTEGIPSARDSDQRASFEIRLHLPWLVERLPGLEGAEAFMEYAGEDMLHPPLPSAVGRTNGGGVVYRGWTGCVEYFDTATARNRWYDNHSVYGESHFYRGYPLGLALGPDAKMFWVGIWSPPGPLQASIKGGRQRLGIFTERNEKRVTGAVALRAAAGERVVLETEVGAEDRSGGAVEPSAPPPVRLLAVLRLTVR